MTIEPSPRAGSQRSARRSPARARHPQAREAWRRSASPRQGATIAAIAIAFFWTIPTFGLLVTSFRPPRTPQTSGWWTVFTDPDFTLGNYAAALTAGGTALTLAESFLNSLAITIPVVIVRAGVASLLAYAFAWIDFRGKKLLFVGGVRAADRPAPDGSGAAAEPVLARTRRSTTSTIFPGLELREVDHSFATVWIAHTIFALPLAVFLLHNFIAEIPARSSRRHGWTARATARSSSG